MSNVVEKITDEIGQKGVIPFARFMELALYCPDYGFYEKEKDNVGQHGDFFTSVSVGSLFGELLAFQFAGWLECEPEQTRSMRIVEAGAHDGRLAMDILRWLREHRGEAFSRIEYCIIEPSARRRGWQRETLVDFERTVRWLPKMADLKTLPVSRTIIFSNELLDAMPFHRLAWDAKARAWFEWGVALEVDRFIWSRLPGASYHITNPTSHLPEFEKLLEVLPDGFVVETSPAAEAWWRDAADVVENGKLLAIDYGLTGEEFFVPERSDGTARAYFRHHVNRDLLANPGGQDITAHVNFTAIETIGKRAGLTTEIFATQGKFLTGIAEQTWKRAVIFGEWDSHRTRQFQTLTHPEHLGRPFRVLVQSRAQPQAGA